MLKKMTCMILAMLLCASVALAETNITVTGTGTAYLAADVATISLGVKAIHQDVLKAQAEVNTSVAAIRQALLDAGVGEADIHTDVISIYPLYDYSEGVEKLTAYTAETTLAIQTRQVEQVGTLIDISFAHGANTLSGVIFSADDMSGARSASLTEAVTEARATAETIASAAGLHITGIVSITEGYVTGSNSGVTHFARSKASEDAEEAPASAEAPTQVYADRLSVTANVTAVFSAE